MNSFGKTFVNGLQIAIDGTTREGPAPPDSTIPKGTLVGAEVALVAQGPRVSVWWASQREHGAARRRDPGHDAILISPGDQRALAILGDGVPAHQAGLTSRSRGAA
jgi:hypothetical protein